jgi:hypothetical protein
MASVPIKQNGNQAEDTQGEQAARDEGKKQRTFSRRLGRGALVGVGQTRFQPV